MMSEIDQIINHSSRQEIIEFLQNPESEFDSVILCYHTTDGEYGFRKMDSSSIVSIVGMLRVIGKYWERIEVDGLITDSEEDEEA